MKYVSTRFASGLAVMGLAWALLASPALAQTSPGAQTTTTTTTTAASTNPTKRSEACSAVRQRLAAAPQILTRIEANLDLLNGHLDNARLPARRVSLEDRIERLEALRSELAQKIAAARRSCATA